MQGITVVLYEQTQTGTNAIGEPIFTETSIEVDNVLVAPSTSEEILDSVNLYGKKAVYTLGIPKGDTHDWQDRKVTIWGQDYHSFGIPLKGIDALVPTAWNMKVTVERYE